MTKQEIIDKYGSIPNDIKVLELLLNTPLRTIGRLLLKEMVKEKK